VVLQARDGETALEEPVDFPPYLLQWAGTGCSLCYLSRSLRAHSKLVTIDVLPRSAARKTQGSGARSTRDTVRSRVLREGDLLFFTHLGTRGGGRGGMLEEGDSHDHVAVHASVEGLVEFVGANPRQPTNTTVVTNRSGLFSAPQWCPRAAAAVADAGAGDYLLLAEEVVTPGAPAASAGARERERQSLIYTNNFLVRESVTYVERGADLAAPAEGAGAAGRRGEGVPGAGVGSRGAGDEGEGDREEGARGGGKGGEEVRLPPAVAEMSQNISSNDTFWSGRWWIPSGGRAEGKEGASRDKLGVVGQYNTAWQRLNDAGAQQLVVADRRGGREVLGRLDGVSVSFAVSPDGEALAVLDRQRRRAKERIWREQLAIIPNFGRLVSACLGSEGGGGGGGGGGRVLGRAAEGTAGAGEGSQRKRASVMGMDGFLVNEVCGGDWARGGGMEEEEEERCLAFFWSPDSKRLLYLTSRRGDAEMFRNLRYLLLPHPTPDTLHPTPDT